MAETEYQDVRVTESLRVKIGEAKNLPASTFSGSGRSTCCAIKIDSEEIFRTRTVDKSTDPFFDEEFQGEIPKKFRSLSFYMYEVGSKNKVLGKVSLKKEELYKYHQKEHWFPLTYQDGDTEVQGKVHLEVKWEEFLTPSSDTSQRMIVRVIECSDLSVISGSCNPYAVVTMSYGKSKTKEVKKTAVKKKTICPQFDETIYFSIDNRGQEKSSYFFDDFMAGELSISLFHDDSKVSREVLGNIFKGAFLGEVKIAINDIDFSRPHKAWYCLQAKEQNRACNVSLGSIRLRISYTADYVFPCKYYNGLRDLILKSPDTKPFTSSAVFILDEIANYSEGSARENAAKPLVKLFLHHGKLVPVINALACWEMSVTTDPNALFRGSSLLTKMVDELMKIIGLPYLHDTLKSFVDQVISESKPCEVNPCCLKDGDDLTTGMNNLYRYVSDAMNMIVGSGLVCPPIMRDVFSTLRSQAMLRYPNNIAVRYQSVTSFIFLRFFTAAIMGPNLFDLYSETLEPSVQRTFTLISKCILSLVSAVTCRTSKVTAKEEYMLPLMEMFPQLVHTEIKMFLDIISSSSGSHVKVIEAPIVLKEGYLIKRAQGRKRFGIMNFRKRFFRLSSQTLSYCKNKGDKHILFEIPITDILAVERLEEASFKMKYMFQVLHAQRALYIQASNCVEEKEWLDILTKICKSNKNRLKFYHPAAFINNHWLCCKVTDASMAGCKPATGGLPLDDILGEIDSDREVQKIHSFFLSAIELLDNLQGYVDVDDVCDETCGSQVVYSGDTDVRGAGLGSNIEDPSSCFATIAEIQQSIITLEQEHLQYMQFIQSRTVIGSVDTPIGDDSSTDLVRNINRSSERLSRHGSRSSNASNLSRQSFLVSRSRGGSFQDWERGSSEGVRKSSGGDRTALMQNLGVEFAARVLTASSYEVMDADWSGGEGGRRARSVSGDSKKDEDSSICFNITHRNNSPTGATAGKVDINMKNSWWLSSMETVPVSDGAERGSSSDKEIPRQSAEIVPSDIGGDPGGCSSQCNNSFISTEDASVTSGSYSGCVHPQCGPGVIPSSIQSSGILESSCSTSDTLTETVDINKSCSVHIVDIDKSVSSNSPGWEDAVDVSGACLNTNVILSTHSDVEGHPSTIARSSSSSSQDLIIYNSNYKREEYEKQSASQGNTKYCPPIVGHEQTSLDSLSCQKCSTLATKDDAANNNVVNNKTCEGLLLTDRQQVSTEADMITLSLSDRNPEDASLAEASQHSISGNTECDSNVMVESDQKYIQVSHFSSGFDSTISQTCQHCHSVGVRDQDIVEQSHLEAYKTNVHITKISTSATTADRCSSEAAFLSDDIIYESDLSQEASHQTIVYI